MNNTPNIIFNDNHLGALIHFRQEVIKSLFQAGCKIWLVAPTENKADIFDKLDKSIRIQPVILNRTSKSLYNILIYFCQLYKIFRRVKPTVVINYTIIPIVVGSVVAKITRTKTVAFFAGLNTSIANILKDNSFKSRIIKNILKQLLYFNRKIIFLNEEDKDVLINAKVIHPDQVIVLEGGEGVDLEKYKPNDTINEKPKNIYKIAMVSRILKSKGYDEFIYSARKSLEEKLPIKYILVGGIDTFHPDRVSEEEIQIEQNAGIINYLGHIDNIPTFLKEIDCMVLPSYYNEGMNRSLMEALSMGIPIITTNNRGCRELVLNGKTGYVIPPHNGDALFKSIKKYLQLSIEEKNNMKRESRKYAEKRFDVNKVISVYRKLVFE